MKAEYGEQEVNSPLIQRRSSLWKNAILVILNRSAIAFALIGTALYLIALASYRAVMVPGVLVSPGAITRSGLVSFFVLYIVSLLAFRISVFVDQSNKNASEIWVFASTRRIAILLLLFWLPILLIRFPGNYDPDTIWELLQLYGYFPLSDQHPWLDTLIFGGFWKMGDVLGSHSISLFLFCFIQLCLTALAFGHALHYFVSFCPSWTLIACLVFLCGFPFVPMVAQSMMKDSLFAWLFLLHVVMFIRIVRSRGEALRNKRCVLSYALISLSCCLTKKTGLYIIVIDTVACMFWIKRKESLRWFGACLLSIVLFSVGWESIVLPVMGVTKGSGGEALSAPFQQVGLLLKTHGSELGEHDWAILNGVFNSGNTIASDYVPLRSDAVKNHWNDNASIDNKIRFLKWYIAQGIKHPLTYAKAVLVLDYPLIVPDTQYNNRDIESGLFYIDNKYNTNIAKILGAWSNCATEKMIEAKLDTTILGESGRRVSANFDSSYLKCTESAPILFCKALYGFWIPFLVLAQSVRQRSMWKFLSLVPVILVALVLAVGPVVLPRYMTTSIYLIPVELCIMFAAKCLPDIVSS